MRDMKNNDKDDKDKDFGFFEEPEGEEMSKEDLDAMMSEDDMEVLDYREEELRMTHVALRHQLMRDAMAFVREDQDWKKSPFRAKLMRLQLAYRLMTKLTEDE